MTPPVPLAVEAAEALAGDGTDEAAQWWLSQAPAIPGTLVRDGHPGDINDPERYPED